MALPKLATIEYPVTIPSSGQRTTFRPYNVGEEKILLTAYESGDQKQIVLAMKQIIGLCVNNINTEELKVFDFQYLFVKIRSVSVSNSVDVSYRVSNCPLKQAEADKSCDKTIKLNIKLDEAKVQIRTDGAWTTVDGDKFEKKIQVTDKIGLVLTYPSFNQIEEITETSDSSQIITNFCLAAIESVWDEDTVYTKKDFSREELLEFYLSLTPNVREEIIKFIDNIPVLRYEQEYSCPSCDFKTTIQLEGIDDFFG